jgi:hypothetical protein
LGLRSADRISHGIGSAVLAAGLAGGLLLLAVLNVVPATNLKPEVAQRHRGFAPKLYPATASQQAQANGGLARDRFALLLLVGERAEGREVVDHRQARLDHYHALGLARVRIERREYAADLDQAEAEALRERGWRDGTYLGQAFVFVEDSGTGAPLRTMTDGETLFVADDEMLARLGIDWRR